MHIFPRPPEAQVASLLAACNLPSSDLAAKHLEHFFGCGAQSDPKGVVGVELFGTVALLRSLAVDEATRGRGCGRRLVRQAEAHAFASGVRSLYLLTTTAARFFESLEYRRVERAALPEAIRFTAEFSRLCPSSAIAMSKDLLGA